MTGFRIRTLLMIMRLLKLLSESLGAIFLLMSLGCVGFGLQVWFALSATWRFPQFFFFFVSVFGLILVGGVLTVLPFSAIFPTFVLLLLTARSTIKKKNNSNALQIILKIKKKLVCNLLLYSEQLNYY